MLQLNLVSPNQGENLGNLAGQRYFELAVWALATVFAGGTVANAKTAN